MIAAAHRPGVLVDAVEDVPGTGTTFRPAERRLAVASSGSRSRCRARAAHVDAGARRAIIDHDASLLPAGVVGVEGTWVPGDAIEIVGPDGDVFAKGIARLAAADRGSWLGKRNDPGGLRTDDELVHRNDLVVLAG